jgi:hypothetical protein
VFLDRVTANLCTDESHQELSKIDRPIETPHPAGGLPQRFVKSLGDCHAADLEFLRLAKREELTEELTDVQRIVFSD